MIDRMIKKEEVQTKKEEEKKKRLAGRIEKNSPKKSDLNKIF